MTIIDGGSTFEHSTLTPSEIHQPGYITNVDPGAVGAGKVWIDTSSGAGNWITKIRNAADTGWETVSGSGGANQLTDLSDVSVAAQTANLIMAAGDGATGGDYRGRALVAADIPNLDAAKIASGTVVHERGGLEADVSAYDGVPRISGGATSEIKYNLSATAAPAVSNDNTQGYGVGSRWVDTTNDKEYVCLDAGTGIAVWTETTQSGGGGSSKMGLWTGWVNSGGASTKGDYKLGTHNTTLQMNLYIPASWSTIDLIEIYILGTNGTGNGQYDLHSDYGAVDEDYQANSESLLNQTLTFTSANDVYKIDAAGVFTSLAPGDVLGLAPDDDATNNFEIGYLGLYIEGTVA